MVFDRRLPDPATVRRDARVPRSTRRAATVIVLLLAVAAGTGLFTDIYMQETTFARNAFRGADLVTLVVVVPVLAWSIPAASHGAVRASLLLLGCLGYAVYQYAYVFAYRWNGLFPVYLVLLSLSAFTLARALTDVDAEAVRNQFDRTTPSRGTGTFLAAVACVLGLVEVGQIVIAIVTDRVPQVVVDSGHPTSPVFVLDLGLVVPLMLLTAAWLRDARPWGYVVAPILLVKGASIGLGLLAANLIAFSHNDKNDGVLNLLWAVITIGCLTTLALLFRHVLPNNVVESSPSTQSTRTPTVADDD